MQTKEVSFAGGHRTHHRTLKDELRIGTKLSIRRKRHTNQYLNGCYRMEFEEIDGEIERKSQTTFSAFCYPSLFTGIFLYQGCIKGISKERLNNL